PAQRPGGPADRASAPAAAARRERRWWIAALDALGTATIGGVGYYVRSQHVVTVPHDVPLVLGVMAIRARDTGVEPWMRELTRDALNTMLSKVTSLRVYSRQKIDFLREKRDLTE